MTSSEKNREFAPEDARPAQVLPAEATPQDVTEWLRSRGVIAAAVQAGKMVPDFELGNASGVDVGLGTAISDVLDHHRVRRQTALRPGRPRSRSRGRP